MLDYEIWEVDGKYIAGRQRKKAAMKVIRIIQKTGKRNWVDEKDLALEKVPVLQRNGQPIKRRKSVWTQIWVPREDIVGRV